MRVRTAAVLAAVTLTGAGAVAWATSRRWPRPTPGWCSCGTTAKADGGYQDRCGYGPRLPLLAVSPFARPNTIDHSITNQSSILRFIEDNWVWAGSATRPSTPRRVRWPTCSTSATARALS